jgi:ABC-type polar amino acid transport system ATPase subunit
VHGGLRFITVRLIYNIVLLISDSFDTAFDAALVIFTIYLLVKRSAFVNLSPPNTFDSLKQTFMRCIEPLQQLDEGNRTIDKCCRCLQRLAEVLDLIGITFQSLFQLLDI